MLDPCPWWGRKVARLPASGVLIAATDLQGNLGDYEALKAVYRREAEAGNTPILLLCGDLRQRLDMPDQGVGQLRAALQVMPPDTRPEDRAALVERIAETLERIGQGGEAERLRADEARRPR